MLTIAVIENGAIVDSVVISREEFQNISEVGAWALLNDLQIGE